MLIHFWSSTEYAGFLAGLIRELNAHADVAAEQRFLISESSYRGAHSWLARKWLRVQQYILYPLQLVFSLLFGKKADVVVVCTNTFYAPLLATFLHKRVVHLVYDLFPEALIHAGKMSGEGMSARIIHKITQATLNRCEANVFLGERLKDYVAENYEVLESWEVIAVGADDTLFEDKEPKELSETTILYCGNLGHMHDVATLFGAWQNLKGGESGIHWRFQSVGPRHNELVDSVARLKDTDLSITVGPGLAQAEWIRVMESSGIALVTMVPGSEEVVMPSKSYSALAAGQAILAVAPKSSDLVSMIEENGCGWWVEPGNVDGLVELIQGIKKNPDEVQRRRMAAQRAAREKYSQKALARKWLSLVQNSRT